MSIRSLFSILFFICFSFVKAQVVWTVYNTSNSPIASDTVFGVAIDGYNYKWIGTKTTTINRFSGGAWDSYTDTDPYIGFFCGNIVPAYNGNVYIGTDNSEGVVYLNPFQKYQTQATSGNPDNITSVIYSYGGTWMGSIGGTTYEGTLLGGSTMWYSFIPKVISALTLDTYHNYWFGSVSNGAVKTDKYGSSTVTYDTTTGLPSDSILTLGADSLGNVWIATAKGVAELTSSSSLLYYNTSNSPLTTNKISCFGFASNVVWMGTKTDGLFRYDGVNWRHYNTSNSGIPDNYITAVAVEHDTQKVWIGTHSKGLVLLDLAGTKTCNMKASFKLDSVTSPNDFYYFSSTSTGTDSTTKYYWNTNDSVLNDFTGSRFWRQYTSNGTYAITLFLEDTIGNCTADTTIYINVNTVAPSGCKLAANFVDSLGAGGLVLFRSITTGTTKSTMYYWDAGDGIGYGNDSVFSHTYAYNGTYAVQLSVNAKYASGGCLGDTIIYVTVTNAPPCNLKANFTDSAGTAGQYVFKSTSAGTDSLTQYYWDAGDGYGTGNTNVFSYTYPYNGTYLVNLFISNSSGTCVSDTLVNITVANAKTCLVHADFTYTALANGEIKFKNTSPGASAYSQCYWNTGDTTLFGWGNTFYHTYTFNGTYPVTLYEMQDSGYCISDTTINVIVTNANYSSNCSFTMTLVSSRSGCDTCSNGKASVHVSGGSLPYTYAWSNGATTSSITGIAGIYTCCVEDNSGCNTCNQVIITDSCLFASFSYNIVLDTAGDTATIYFTSVSDTVCSDSIVYHNPGPRLNPPVLYQWNFGDGISQQIGGIGVTHCQHKFALGNYNVSLAIKYEGRKTKSVAVNHIKVEKKPTGIEILHNNKASLTLFPNPNNGSFEVYGGQLLPTTDKAEISISDLLGKTLYASGLQIVNGRVNENVTLPSSFAPGTYLVKVITNSSIYNTKLVIVR